MDLQEILDLVTAKVAEVMKAEVCTLRLVEGIEENRLVLRAAHGLNSKITSLKKDVRMNEAYAVVDAVKEATPVMVDNLLKDTKYRHDPFDKAGKFRSMICVPLIEKDKVVGTLSIYSRRLAFYSNWDKKVLGLFAAQASIAIENARLFEKARSNYINTMRFFASLIDAKDRYTAGHSDRVMKHVYKLADRLGLSRREREILRYASYLHDIGKISIDPAILSKQGKLTEVEWKQIKNHPVVGSQIIKKIGFLDDVIPVILYHHEKYGGGGYPHGDMKNGQIPLMARILAVVDAYEAMTSDRPYRKALTDEQAIGELKKHSGTQFDPAIVKHFVEILGKSHNKPRLKKPPTVG